MGLVGLVPLCLRAFCGCKFVFPGYFKGFKLFFSCVFESPKFFIVSNSWVQKFFSWVFLGLKFFFMSTSCVQNFFVGIRDYESFSRVYFEGSTFFSWVFPGSKILSRGYFVGSIFSCSWFRDSKLFSCWLHEQDWQKQKYKNTFQTMYSFLNQFQQLSIVYIRKVFFFSIWVPFTNIHESQDCRGRAFL